MFTLKHIVVFFMLQKAVYSLCFHKYCLGSSYSSESTDSDESSYFDVSQYWDEYSEENSNEYSEENSNEYSEENSNEYPEENSNEYSEENSNVYSEENSNEKSVKNSNENSVKNSNENFEKKSSKNSEKFLNKICPEEEHSLISHSDIKYMIEDKADILKIKENLVNNYYPVAKEIFKKYVGELEEFQGQLNNRPEHILHILHDMASSRQKLEPEVEEITTQLEQFYALEDDINDEAEKSAIMLSKLENYKNMCNINCQELSVENRFGHKIDNNPFIFSQSAGMYCVRVKDFNDNINKKLSEVQVKHDEGLNQQLEFRDKMYAEKISELKINLKEAAVKQFGMTMYDILSLQDDHHHFVRDIKHLNISSATCNILENFAEIGFRLIGLRRDLEKYRQYCMKCNVNQRVKRNVFDLLHGSLDGVEESVMPIEKRTEAKTNYIDELINVKIDEIRASIESNFTSMFEELDEKLNNSDVVDVYVAQLHPIQNEIGNDIKMEQEALRRLTSRIPEASINKILALSKESKQTIQNLESAKQFIAQFISRNSK